MIIAKLVTIIADIIKLNSVEEETFSCQLDPHTLNWKLLRSNWSIGEVANFIFKLNVRGIVKVYDDKLYKNT